MTLREYLSIPYFLVMESVPYGDKWIRRASYPELEGCVVQEYSPLKAIEELEKLKVRTIVEKLSKGEPIPTPYEPLRSAIPELDLKRICLTEYTELLDYDEREMQKVNIN